MSVDLKRAVEQVVIMVVYTAFIWPDYFNQFQLLDFSGNLVRIAFFLMLTFYFFFIRKKISINFALLAAYAAWPLLVTLSYRGELIPAIRLVVLSLGLLMWSEYLGKKHPEAQLDALNLLLEILVYINLLTILLVPEGLYRYTTQTGWASDKVWLFGLRNAHTFFLVLGCSCSTLKYYYSEKGLYDKARLGLMHGVTILTIYLLKSGGGYVALTAYFLMLAAINVFRRIRIDFSYAIAFQVILFYAITRLSATMLFSDYFALFGKNGTATGRLRIWAHMWEHIAESPLFGHGFMKDADLLWLQHVAAGAKSGHNAMIDMFFRGGLITFITFILLLFGVREKLKLIAKERFLYNYAVISFTTFFLARQSEGGMDSAVLFSLIGLLCALPDINSAQKLKWQDRSSEQRVCGVDGMEAHSSGLPSLAPQDR